MISGINPVIKVTLNESLFNSWHKPYNLTFYAKVTVILIEVFVLYNVRINNKDATEHKDGDSCGAISFLFTCLQAYDFCIEKKWINEKKERKAHTKVHCHTWTIY
jgi:hypothetical protein